MKCEKKFHREMNRTDRSVDIQPLQNTKRHFGNKLAFKQPRGLMPESNFGVMVIACKVDCRSHFRATSDIKRKPV